ncbi:FtsX-like permease family protein [Jannaschia formosa]|nr:FtsX-like permease family protein [Jannaschia formosa]
MRALDLKLLRDLRRLWAQVLAIAAVLGCGVAVLLMSLGMSDALDRSRAAYYEREAFAQVFARATRAPLGLAGELRAIPGVRDVEARVSRFVLLDLPGRVRPATAQVVSLPDAGPPRLNRLVLRSGRWPEPGRWDEVIVDAPFAAAQGYRPGDRFAANLGGARRELTVVGTALSPEFVYTIGPGAMMPDPSGHAVIWMPRRAAEAAFDMTGAFDDAVIALRRGADEASVIAAIDRLLAPYGATGAHGRDRQISHAFLDSEIETLRVMAWILPPVFLLITAFLVNMVMARIVALERAEIGLLKAAGYSNGAVLSHYLLLAGLIASVGIALGLTVGGVLAREMAGLYARFYNFPELIFSMSWTAWALGALAGFAAAGLGATRAALGAARLPPAVAMAPPSPPRFARGAVDRLLSAVRLPQTDMMILRSVLRWPLRAGTAVLGYALGTAILVSSSFFSDSLDGIMERAFDLSNRADVVLSFPRDLPVDVIAAVRDLPGVLQAEGHVYAAVRLSHGHLTEDATIQALPPGSDLTRMLDGTRPAAPPDAGAVLTDRLAARLGVRPGEVLRAELVGLRRDPVALRVAGLVPEVMGATAYMTLSGYDRLLGRPPKISSVAVTLRADGEAAFHRAVKAAPAVGGALLLADNRRAFESTIAQNMTVMATVYVVLGSAIAIGVAYNGARIQLSERARELASLRILGLTRWEVSWVLVGEVLLLALLAQPLGWALGYGIAALMADRFSSEFYTLPLVVEPATFAFASLVSLGASVASVMLVRRRIDRLDLVAVMKTRE